MKIAGWVASFRNPTRHAVNVGLEQSFDEAQDRHQFRLVYTYTICIIFRMNITHDPVKNKVNRKKHQIDLAEVEGAFYDDRAITVEDRDHAEERFVTLGMDGIGRLLVVVYHYRGEDEIRVISARLAEPHERCTYQEG